MKPVMPAGDVDAALAILLAADFVDETSACVGAEVYGCEARIEPGASYDDDVPVCCDCYGDGRQT